VIFLNSNHKNEFDFLLSLWYILKGLNARTGLVEARHMERDFGYVNIYEEHKRTVFLSVKRCALPILSGNKGFKEQSLASGGGVMSPNAYTGSNRKTFLCNSKIITNST